MERDWQYKALLSPFKVTSSLSSVPGCHAIMQNGQVSAESFSTLHAKWLMKGLKSRLAKAHNWMLSVACSNPTLPSVVLALLHPSGAACQIVVVN